jgi:hypothetical protein
MRDWLIGTGFYASAANAAKAAEFSRLWDRCNAVAPVVVVDNSDNGFETKHRVIRVEKNLGHYIRIWNKPNPCPGSMLLCGWSMSWILPAMVAYCEGRDFVYIEQDCLCLGNWAEKLREDIAASGKKALYGPPSTSVNQACEQSLFWLDWSFINGFVALYFDQPGDNQKLCEDKFMSIMNEHPNMIGMHSLRPGRDRPIPDSGPASAQQLTEQELQHIIQTRNLWKTGE